MRRRHKQKFTWFPVLGTSFGSENPNNSSLFFEELIVPLDDTTPPESGSGQLFCVPVTPDFTIEPSADRNAQNSLRDVVEGQDWLLKRLVGKIFCSVRTGADASSAGWPAVIVTCGFFVGRSDDADQTAVDLTDAEVNPQNVDNIMNPWIWRRSWKLGNPGADHFDGAGQWPANNGAFGSVLDGPHLDSKMSRRILREQRLWFAGAALGISPIGLSVAGATTVDISMDLRVLGALRRGRNRSAF